MQVGSLHREEKSVVDFKSTTGPRSTVVFITTVAPIEAPSSPHKPATCQAIDPGQQDVYFDGETPRKTDVYPGQQMASLPISMAFDSLPRKPAPACPNHLEEFALTNIDSFSQG